MSPSMQERKMSGETATRAAIATRAELGDAMSMLLASTQVLYQKSQFFHWNVIGGHFLALHKLFEDHYVAMQTIVDDIAERMRALGFQAPGTFSEFLTISAIQEDLSAPQSDRTMVEILLRDHEICSSVAQKTSMVPALAHDQATVDLLNKSVLFHDKAAWMLRSLLSQEKSE